MKMAIPSISMTCMEWWSFEILAFFAAYISMTAISANVIILNTAVIAFMFALGIQYAASTLVGKSIGESNILKAKRF